MHLPLSPAITAVGCLTRFIPALLALVCHEGDRSSLVVEGVQAASFACNLHSYSFSAQVNLRLLTADPLQDHDAALHECAVQQGMVSCLTTVDIAVGYFFLGPAVAGSVPFSGLRSCAP